MTLPLLPMRGEVWDVGFPRIGPHPAVVLTVNALRGRLSELTVVLVTGTLGPRATHIPLGADAGVTRYDESYVNATSVHTVPAASCRTRRGRLAPAELDAVATAMRLVLGL